MPLGFGFSGGGMVRDVLEQNRQTRTQTTPANTRPESQVGADMTGNSGGFRLFGDQHDNSFGILNGARDARHNNKQNFNNAFNSGDRDLLNNNQTFGIANDLNRLEIINSNEGGAVDDRLNRQVRAIEDTTNRVGEDEAVAKAGQDAENRSRSDDAQFERATRGMDLSDRQKKSAARRQTLSRALNRASAQGATRRGFTDRSKAAASQGGGFADAIFSQRVAGETAIASAFVNKKAADDQARAERKKSSIGVVGSIIGGALAFFSSEELKHDHGHEGKLLEKLKKVRVNRWQYKGDNKTHVGPFSEEFNREFGIDTDRPDMINVIDALGVTMGAIKELDKKVSAHG